MKRDPELRVLSGCHAGARAALAGGERLGATEDCDLVLSDLGLPADASGWVGLAPGRWWVGSAPPEPTGAEAAGQTSSSHWVAENAWGEAAYLGQVAITVSPADAPWQALPAGLQASEPAQRAEEPVAAAEPTETAPPLAADGGEAAEAPLALAPAPGAPVSADESMGGGAAAPAGAGAAARRWHPAWIVGAAFAALLLSVLWALLQGREAARVQAAEQQADASASGEATAQRQQRLLSEIQMAIARVDPTLRLRVELLPAGGARVSGWVADIAQLDRLADGLADIRPVPALSVRTAAELMDDLVDIGAADGPALRFELAGEGRVRALGLVPSAAEREKVLASVRARMPPGIDIVDGLRVASEQGGAVQDWLRTAGFAGAQALWDGDQMVIGLDIARQERARLEALLARPGTPLSGIPFVVRTREIVRTPPPPVARVHANAAPLPFRIRSVVSGPMPYVVLGDGSKLQPGGRRAGWRLVAVEPDRLVFDGPRALEVLR